MLDWNAIDFKFSEQQRSNLSIVVQDDAKLPAVERMLVEATKRQLFRNDTDIANISKIKKNLALLLAKLKQARSVMMDMDPITAGVLKAFPSGLELTTLEKYIKSTDEFLSTFPEAGRGSATSTRYTFALDFIVREFPKIYGEEQNVSYSPTSKFYSIVDHWLKYILNINGEFPERQIKTAMNNVANAAVENHDHTTDLGTSNT
ncbi:hypothetical protein AB4876_16200 [Zhongshania guokunii]|uniref:Uncharacterized protein n=1 Tax=Zhongshania guokunii TaxID=641783 RepID=A0ABV3UCI7_9GAMM